MKNKWQFLLVLSLIFISLLISSVLIYQRISLEKSNNSVELVLDYTDAENLALNEGLTTKAVLTEFKKAGITSLAITENTLIDSEREGLISISTENKLLITLKEKSYRTDLMRGLLFSFGHRNAKLTGDKIELSSSLDEVFNKGIGLSPKKIKLAKELGFLIIPRLKNSYTLTNISIENKINSAKKSASFNLMIFDGEEVLGYPNYVKETSIILKNKRIKYGYIELAKQNGDSSLLRSSGANAIKLHSISADELRTMRTNTAIQRFTRAAYERSLRVLYIHTYPYPAKGKGLLETNIGFIKNIAARLESRGFQVEKASTPGSMGVNRFFLALLTLGVTASIILFASYFIPIGLPVSLIILFFSSFISLGMGALAVKKLFALVAAVAFPIFAVTSHYPTKIEESKLGLIPNALLTVLYMVGITFMGGVLIVGLLSDTSFLSGINKFSGVKLSLLVPLIAVAAYLFLRDAEGNIKLQSMKDKIMSILDIQITIKSAAIMFFGLLALAILLLRSGNFGLPILIIEKLFRSLLEVSLAIRPRTKEFLIGYPALLLGTIYYLKGGRNWLPVWAAIGTLALVSMTNTFCHIHTPLTITIIRSLYGLILGLVLGLIIYGTYLLSNILIKKLNK